MQKKLSALIEQQVVTDDDRLILDAFKQSDIKHVCQAIRDVKSADVVYQHVTLRFGSRGEQSVYSFDLSEGMRYALDLYSLYLALRQSRFQIDTFHPTLLNQIVVPIDANALLWRQGFEIFKQMLTLDSRAFRYLIPSLQIKVPESAYPQMVSLMARIRGHAHALWFDISVPCEQMAFVTKHQPDCVKLAISLENKEDRNTLLPIVRTLRSLKLNWVAGRVSSQSELSQYRLLGASHYFGYISDIPTSMVFKSLLDEDEPFVDNEDLLLLDLES